MREAGRLVGEVLTELAGSRGARCVDGGSGCAGGEADSRGRGDAGVQGLPRVPGDDLRVDQRGSDPRDPLGTPVAERRRRHLDRRRCVARRLLRRQRGHAGGRAGVGGGGDAAAGHRRVALQGDRAWCSRAGGSRTSATRCSSTSKRMGFRSCASSSGTASASRCTRSRRCRTTAQPGRGPRLTEGMVLAIEPMVNAGKAAVKVLADGWTAVTRDGTPVGALRAHGGGDGGRTMDSDGEGRAGPAAGVGTSLSEGPARSHRDGGSDRRRDRDRCRVRCIRCGWTKGRW